MNIEKDLFRKNVGNLFIDSGYDYLRFYSQRLFAIMFDKMPSFVEYDFSYYFDNEIATNYLLEKLEAANFEHISSVETIRGEQCNVPFTFAKNTCVTHTDHHLFIDVEKQIFVFFDPSSVYCIYEFANAESKKWCEDFLSQFHIFCQENQIQTPQIECIGCDERRFYLRDMSIKLIPNMDIKTLYNDDFIPVDENIRRFMENDHTGLVILHGEQGTGKTSYIRHLVSVTNKHFVYLPLDLASSLSDPQMITFICNKLANAVLIIEDCEQLLVDRSSSGDHINTGLVNILNMADGLLGDSLNLKFICTFNSDLQKIDKALLRKGRLVDKYEFGKLSKEKTTALMQNLYNSHDIFEPMTLAEIYNYQVDNHGENKQRKCVGF